MEPNRAAGPDADRWGVRQLDLDAYLRRIGADVAPPSAAALAALHRRRRQAIAFEWIDVLIGRPPAVDVAGVQAKLVGRRRGGYCFEHGVLFAAAAERLGYRVTRRLGRVGDPQAVGRTHLTVEVQVDGERFLCDPGFSLTLLEPIPLAEAEVEQNGTRFRLRETADGDHPTWQLSRLNADAWEVMHTCDNLPVRPVDIAIGNHWTSTGPVHFRSSLGVALTGDGWQRALSADTLTERRAGAPTAQRPWELAELPDLLASLGVRLTDEELALLTDAVAALRTSRPG